MPGFSAPRVTDINLVIVITMSKTFRQIRSSFNDPDDKMVSFKFETMEDLLHLDFVRRNTCYRSFFRFSITKDNTLMAEYKDGFEWWVVGNIDDPSNLGLPEWRAKYHALLDGKEVTLDEDEVAYSCGNELTLRGGRKATWLRS